LLSLSESVLLTNANLPWTLLLAILARGMMADPQARATLAPEPVGAYLTRSRIASQYAHGSRRPLLLR